MRGGGYAARDEEPAMKFSYNAVWDDTVAMLKANGGLLAALAGVFLFLPSLLFGYIAPQPQGSEASLASLFGYFRENVHWALAVRLVNIVGTLAMLILLFARGGVTVGGSIAGSFHFFLAYLVASFLSSLIIGLGFVALILPGLYLFARLAPLGPIVVAESRRNPIDAIKRSFAVTKGNGWAVLGLLVAVVVAVYIVSFALTAVLGTLFLLTLGQKIGGLLVLIVQSAFAAALGTILIVLSAAIYRRLTASPSAAVAA